MKFRALFLSFFVVFLFFCSCFAADEIEEQAKLKKLQEKLLESKKKLVETKKKESQTLTKLVVTKKKLAETQKSLVRVNTKIAVNQKELSKMVTELKVTHENLTVKSEILKKRLREVYKNSTVNYLELIFSSKSMADFINRAYFFSKIIEHDTDLIEDISQDYNKIQTDKTKLSKSTQEITELAGQIEEQKSEMAEQAKEINELYSQIKERRENYEKQIAEMEKSSKELERVIMAKMAERRKQHGAIVGNTGALDWPLRGRITSSYGYRRHPLWGGRHFHTGLDIAAPYGEPIRAADGGEVILSGWWDGYGKAVVIDHGNNTSTVYGHMSRLYLQAGNQVKKGQIIGLVGSTGYSTGPHLHFEVRINGKTKNPIAFLP